MFVNQLGRRAIAQGAARKQSSIKDNGEFTCRLHMLMLQEHAIFSPYLDHLLRLSCASPAFAQEVHGRKNDREFGFV